VRSYARSARGAPSTIRATRALPSRGRDEFRPHGGQDGSCHRPARTDGARFSGFCTGPGSWSSSQQPFSFRYDAVAASCVGSSWPRSGTASSACRGCSRSSCVRGGTHPRPSGGTESYLVRPSASESSGPPPDRNDSTRGSYSHCRTVVVRVTGLGAGVSLDYGGFADGTQTLMRRLRPRRRRSSHWRSLRSA
jgi:hypothetical protein